MPGRPGRRTRRPSAEPRCPRNETGGWSSSPSSATSRSAWSARPAGHGRPQWRATGVGGVRCRVPALPRWPGSRATWAHRRGAASSRGAWPASGPWTGRPGRSGRRGRSCSIGLIVGAEAARPRAAASAGGRCRRAASPGDWRPPTTERTTRILRQNGVSDSRITIPSSAVPGTRRTTARPSGSRSRGPSRRNGPFRHRARRPTRRRRPPGPRDFDPAGRREPSAGASSSWTGPRSPSRARPRRHRLRIPVEQRGQRQIARNVSGMMNWSRNSSLILVSPWSWVPAVATWKGAVWPPCPLGSSRMDQ